VSGALVEALIAGAPYSLRELGIMAKIGTGTEQLYTVANVFADVPDTITPGGTSTHAFDITVVIDQASSISVTIGNPNTVDCQNIPTTPATGPGLYAQRVGNVFQFKRLVAGPGIAFTEASDRVTVSVKVITVDLNLYVPASHPDAPGPEVAFATLQAAFDYLAEIRIPFDKKVTIHIYRGVFTTTSGIICSHPNSARIFVVGDNPIIKTVSAITHFDATHKKVTVNNTTDLAVDHHVTIVDSPAGFAGGCKITAIAGNVLTVTIEKRDSRVAYTTPAGSGSRLIRYPTVLVCDDPPKNNTALWCPFGLGALQWVTMLGGRESLYAENFVWIIGCLFRDNTTGLFLYQCSALLQDEVTFTQCDVAIDGDELEAQKLYINGCERGIQTKHSKVGNYKAGLSVGFYGYFSHCIFAINISLNAELQGGNLKASSNESLINCGLGSTATINHPAGPQTTFDNMPAVTAQAAMNSFILWYRNGGPVPICQPPAETVGIFESLIHVEP